ncbi:hypothetical protein FT663_02218 [Candidozyma haemuli var. vulneris]|uniref:Zn(2)-C6 fungal-type domain-containing protein n=1 Tax=Candidozyma haemuli TaxID=45357 RepID=A0A2V1AW64_9ASCO|nr:hypothetical protein CXQ85_004697 [[Candida] haemuloni]KAF3990207.1 hypothetical protein FT662_02417 [[Candida] haemuloni var. vulneris]KAF3992705.1 hypothetical protein FT663_02218 [[Candida] haemuloni var. vulneris]PVH22029.1 hypothetical protein CXQ85_004697 [[Candida] haemuloni]
MSSKKNRKVSCVHCRKLKRKCDGESPCSNCQKRNIVCEYSSTDRRSQRFSLVYIKSLETNAEIYENILNDLVSLRGDKDALSAKLASIEATFPLTGTSKPLEQVSEEMASIQSNEASAENERAHLDDEENYYGPGSIYHFGEYTTPESSKDSPSERTLTSLETVHTNYNFIKSIVVNFFTHQWPSSNSYYLDKNAILTDLHKGNIYESTYLSEELLYAICANSESLSYEEADAYKLLALSKVYPAEVKSSIPLAQAYMLLAAHEFSLGKVTSGWQLSGSAMRMGFDLGFHHQSGPETDARKNRLLFGFMLIDSYICMAVGRPNTITQNNVSVMRLPNEHDAEFHNIRDAVSLLELTRPMHKATYEPISFNKDPRINYLLKFNRSKMFNVKILKWKSDLDPASHWSYASLKASDDLAFQNHNLKFIYWYVLLFINKPFLHVPRQYSAGYIIEEMSKEVYLIVNSRLERMEMEARSQQLYPTDSFKFVRYDQSDPYHWATLDICMITLLSHVVVTLIMDHPNCYMYMEKHLKTFTRYLNGVSARKYKCKHSAMERLLERYRTWRASRTDLPSTRSAPSESEPYEMKQLKESIDAAESSPYSLSTGSEHAETPGSGYGVTSGSDSLSPFDKKVDDRKANEPRAYAPEQMPGNQNINQGPMYNQPPADAHGHLPPPHQQQPPLQMLEKVQFDNSQIKPPYYHGPPPHEYGQYPVPQPPHGPPFHHQAPPPNGPPPNQPPFPPPQMAHPMMYGQMPPQPPMADIQSTPHSNYSVPQSNPPMSHEPSLASVPSFSGQAPPTEDSFRTAETSQIAEPQVDNYAGPYDGSMQQNINFYEAMTQPLPDSQGYNEFQGGQAPSSSGSDDVGQMMDTLFRNTGEEFEAPTDQFNWDKLFDEKYVVA